MRSVFLHLAIGAGAACMAAAIAVTPARAISIGVVQSDGMMCRELFGTPHDHHGRARRHTREEALAEAIHRWSRFTVFEYGKEWGDWSVARRKKVECTGSEGWYCKVDGQPCKTGSGTAHAAGRR